MKQHALNDTVGDQDRIQKAIEDISKQKKRIETFIETHSPRVNHGKREVKSNITDNDSAKLKASSRYIQGYNALALTRRQAPDRVNRLPDRKAVRGDELKPSFRTALRRPSGRDPQGRVPLRHAAG